MSTGTAFRDAFVKTFPTFAKQVKITRLHGTGQPTEQIVEAKKNKLKGTPVFQFVDRIDVAEGDMLRELESAESWRVTRCYEGKHEDTTYCYVAEVSPAGDD